MPQAVLTMEQQTYWLNHFLRFILADDTLELLHRNVLHPNSPVSMVARAVGAVAQAFVDLLSPLVTPLLDRLTVALYNSPDAVVVLFCAFVLLLVYQGLLWVQRLFVWWTRVLFRLALLSILAAVVAVCWNRGAEATARDSIAIVGGLAGWAKALKDVWVSEYQKYDAQAAAAKDAASTAAAHAAETTARTRSMWGF